MSKNFLSYTQRLGILWKIFVGTKPSNTYIYIWQFCSLELQKGQTLYKTSCHRSKHLEMTFYGDIETTTATVKYTGLVCPEGSIILSAGSKLWLINLTFPFQAIVWSQSDEKELANGRIIFGLHHNNKNSEDAFDFYKVRIFFPFWLCDGENLF